MILLEASSRESVIAAFRCGAAGVFCRTESLSELASCIERVSRGEIGANKNHSEFLLETLRSTPSCEGIDAGKIDQLSPRELQVAEHAAQGESNKQIADQLGLSEHTVKNYLFHVFEKLGVSNRFELLFLLFKECNGPTGERARSLGAERPSHRNLSDCRRRRVRRGPVRRRAGASGGILRRKKRCFGVLLVRLAETSSHELGQRSRVLVDQLRSAVQAHEIEEVEQRISIAVKNNKLLQSHRPDEFIKRSENALALNIAI